MFDNNPAFTSRAALSIETLSKSFGKTHALRNVSFAIRDGEIHGLLGGNGSGKSTLIKILAGVHKGSPGGFIGFRGNKVAAEAITPDIARKSGLRFVHQNPAVFGSMTVAENMALGNAFPTIAGRIRWSVLRAKTQKLLDRFEIPARPDDYMERLRPADQSMVAIARALQDADGSDIAALVLDEPTAALPEQEVEILLGAMRRLSKEGHAVVFVSHRLEEVLKITDAVTVLRDGEHVATKPTAEMTEHALIELIVGRRLERYFARAAEKSAERVTAQVPPRLRLRNISGGPLKKIDLDIMPGEIVGIAGLLGSGRTELLRMIFGDLAPKGGEIHINGQITNFSRPAHAMTAGVALVPEHRDREGVFQGLSVMDNLSIGRFSRFVTAGRISRSKERLDAIASIKEYAVKTRDELAPISSLSGGNQQKVVMARCLRRMPQLLLLDEPTQGVDVGAREDLYASIRKAVGTGMAALVVSSDFEELAQICDRVFILKDGRIAAELSGDALTRHSLTEQLLMTGEVTAA